MNNNSCKECGQKELTHLLIAPTKDKIDNDIFDPLWAEAEKSLKETNEIVVIGYSFRETDVKAREIIGKAIASNCILPTLTIVDRDPKKIFNNIKNFSRVDNKHFGKVDYFSEFEQFLQN